MPGKGRIVLHALGYFAVEFQNFPGVLDFARVGEILAGEGGHVVELAVIQVHFAVMAEDLAAFLVADGLVRREFSLAMRTVHNVFSFVCWLSGTGRNAWSILGMNNNLSHIALCGKKVASKTFISMSRPV